MTNFEYKNLRKWMKLSTNCDTGAFGDDISLVYLLLYGLHTTPWDCIVYSMADDSIEIVN